MAAEGTFEKRILVTGGAGFIGSHVVVHLVKKYPHYYIVNLDSLDYCSCVRNVHLSFTSASKNACQPFAGEVQADRDQPDMLEETLRSSFCEWDHDTKPNRSASVSDSNPAPLSGGCASTETLPRNYKFIKGNITCADLVEYVLQTERIDTVMHFAAQSHVDNSFGNSIAFSQTNILGTHVLLEAARIHGGIKRFIHVSTDEVYGEGRFDTEAMTEDHVLEPTNPYAATKAAAEFLVKAYQRSFKLPTIITRSNNVYGPHQYPEKLIPKFINQIARDRPVTIHGDGLHTRNYLYIADVVSAFDIVLHKGDIGQVYNIGGTNERSNKQVAMDLLRFMRPKAENQNGDAKHITYVTDRAFNDLRYTIDAAKIRKLGWKESVSWSEGLQKTVQWYARFGHRFLNIDQALEAHPSDFKKAYTTTMTSMNAHAIP